MDLKEAEIFLEEVKEICKKIPKKEKTFMEIAGFPHYENVCSNILAFYFNPKEEHKFNDIMLKTLLDIIKEKNVKVKTNLDLSNINIFREFITENGNRIDIVIQCDEFAIGIENKIKAEVNNDLNDYSNTLDKLNNNNVKIILSLRDESNIANENDFINITYSELFNKLRNNLIDYADTQNKWYIYLVDFMNNLEGFKVEKDMEKNINEWVKKHQEDINNFYELLNVAKNNIDSKINEYGYLLEEMSPRYRVKYWHDSDVQAGAFIAMGSLGCNLDALLTAEGWKLGLNLWKKLNQIKIKQALRENEKDILEETDGHIYLYNFDYNCSIIDVVNKAREILDLLEKIK